MFLAAFLVLGGVEYQWGGISVDIQFLNINTCRANNVQHQWVAETLNRQTHWYENLAAGLLEL